MSKEILSLITGLLAVVLIVYGSFCLIRLAKKLRNRQEVKYITITPEDIEVLEDALSCSELSWRDLLTENPEACDEDEVHREIAKIRKLSTEFIGTLQDSSPVMIEVSNK